MKFSKASHQLILDAITETNGKGFIDNYINVPGLLLAIVRSNDRNLSTFAEYLETQAVLEEGEELEEGEIEDIIDAIFFLEIDYPGINNLKIVAKSKDGEESKEILSSDEENKSVEEKSKEEKDDKEKVPEEGFFFPISLVKDETNPTETKIKIDKEQLILMAAAYEKGKTISKEKKLGDEAKKKIQEKKVIEKISFYYRDTDDKEHKVYVNESMLKVFNSFMDFEEEYNIKEIEPGHFLAALFYKELEELKEFFSNMGYNYHKAKKFFDVESINSLGDIPKDMEGFLSIINKEIDITKPCEILKRDKETDTLINILLKKNKRNAVIIGEPGVGKTALIEKLAYLIESEDCPDSFKGLKVVLLDVNALIAGTSYRGDAEKRIEGLVKFLKKDKDVILFIDEVHTILGAGSCYEGEMDLANALKPILARGDTRVIGATTEEEYDKYFSKDAALQRRFEKVIVEEPASEDVYEMIQNKIKVLSAYHGVRITRDMVEQSILIASCFAFNKKNPDKTLDLIDRAMVVAKRSKNKVVKKEHVRKNFAIFDELWSNMLEENKIRTAYHETGHYIVCKYSGRLIEYILKAVSILPAEEYLGVTVFEISKKFTPHCSRQYFVDLIAMDLAGRVAEEFISEGDYTSGASEDLKSATKIARNVIVDYGMGKKIGVNRIYSNSCDKPMFSEKVIEDVNSEIDELIEEGKARAKEILTENKDIFMAIQKALLKKHILSEQELDEICKKKIAARVKK